MFMWSFGPLYLEVAEEERPPYGLQKRHGILYLQILSEKLGPLGRFVLAWVSGISQANPQ